MQETAPAKINLTLDILGRRRDGYHDLETVMQTLTLADTVGVRAGERGFSLVTDFPLPPGKKTLEQQAAEAFFGYLGRPLPPLRVTLEKRIPAYAGLGGGSGDVAALLRLLRRRYAPDLSWEALSAIALTVGSDVPFCLRGGTALAEGRGERLTPLPPLPPCWVVLCKPGFDVSTAEAFARADKAPPAPRGGAAAMCTALEAGDLPGVARGLSNAFIALLPPPWRREVERVMARLRALGAQGASMSGSGPTVFGLFSEEETARRGAAALKADIPQTYLAQGAGEMAV